MSTQAIWSYVRMKADLQVQQRGAAAPAQSEQSSPLPAAAAACWAGQLGRPKERVQLCLRGGGDGTERPVVGAA